MRLSPANFISDIGFVPETLCLQQEHAGVLTADLQKLFMVALLDQLALLQDADDLGMPHRREAVGDEDRRNSVSQLEETLE